MESRKSKATSPPTAIRLNRFLAASGVASRRKADELIETGAIQINGRTTYELGLKVNPHKDRITVHGRTIKPIAQKIYVAFYKPENVLTSLSDPLGRPTLSDFIQKLPARVFPVGRLDWDTEGLLILTNDGDLAQKIMHPKYGVTKTYMVKIDGQIQPRHLEKLKRGFTIPGGRVRALAVERVTAGNSAQYDWVKIVIDEGKNRQVRHMFAKLGFGIKKLKRVAIGQLSIGRLRKGDVAFLSEVGIKKVFAKPFARP